MSMRLQLTELSLTCLPKDVTFVCCNLKGTVDFIVPALLQEMTMAPVTCRV